MKLHVSVTAEDIRDGQRAAAWHCPLALAITRALREAGFTNARAGINKEDCVILPIDNDGGGSVRIAWHGTPQSQFVEDFDDGSEVQPFEFDLDVDEDALRRLTEVTA